MTRTRGSSGCREGVSSSVTGRPSFAGVIGGKKKGPGTPSLGSRPAISEVKPQRDLLGDCLLERLARLEGRHLAGRDLDHGAGGGVDSLAGGPVADLEGAEADQRHLFAFDQGLFDRAQDRLNALACSPFGQARLDRKSTRLNSSHVKISYAVFCLK